jgi:hypothetical protein
MDEIDAIGGRRFSEGTSADREIQRTLMELLNQLDGFDELGKVNLIIIKFGYVHFLGTFVPCVKAMHLVEVRSNLLA